MRSLALGLTLLATCPCLAADPWADQVRFFAAGSGAIPIYANPLSVLGAPERYTGEGIFPAAVTPFNPAWGTDEIVSIGAGGSLVVSFDEPVTDDPDNPFGIDFIIFGNAGFIDDAYPRGLVASGADLFGAGAPAHIEVSADGVLWRLLAGRPDQLFPTLGYSDLTDPYATSPGFVPADFTRPVNPALNCANLEFTDLVAAYNGSGGGTGFDLAGSGLSAIFFVRITNVATTPIALEIDALSDVSPVPSPAGGAGLAGLLLLRPRRRRAT